MNFQLAQINVARLRYEIDDPRLADFTGNLDHINAIAEGSEGFIWRLKDEAGNAMSIRAYEDPLVIVNMSVWRSLEALKLFAYRTEHVQFFRRRAEWFEGFGRSSMALWWIEASKFPTAAEGRQRLEHVDVHGPTPRAFTFKENFTAGESVLA
jgi:hypothetical protein